MNDLKQKILLAAHAEMIPEGESGLWHIMKLKLAEPFVLENAKGEAGTGEMLPAGTWTSLFRYTKATIHASGELVMHDFPREIRKHLIFMLRARGRVLVTGLGLGCVARGLLANPMVEKVTVLEQSRHVLTLVGPHMERSDRLEIILAEAEDWIKKNNRLEFDCAWHDVWTDKCAGEVHLHVKHAAMMGAMAGRVRFQGAWDFPREQRRLWRSCGII